MFKRQPIHDQKRREVIKLLKDPIDMSFLDIQALFGYSDSAYLVMHTNNTEKLHFYAKKTFYEISADGLHSIFENTNSFWAREATPEEYDVMKENSQVLSSFLFNSAENSCADQNTDVQTNLRV